MPESATPNALASDVNEVLCEKPLVWLETELANGKDVPALVRFNNQVFAFESVVGCFGSENIVLYKATDCPNAANAASDTMPNIRCGGRNEDIADFMS